MSAPASHTLSADDLPLTRDRMVALAAVIVTVGAVGSGLTLGLPLLSLVLEARGISSTWIGLNNSMAGVAILLIGPFVTPLARRFGAVPMLVAAILLSSVSFFAFYWIETFWVWFVLRLLFHGGLAVMFVLSEFWINSLAPKSKRGLVLGIYATVLSLGFAIGPAVLSVTGSKGMLPFLVGSLLQAAAVIPVLMALGQSPTLDEKPSGSTLSFILLVPAATFGVTVFGAIESGGIAFFALYGVRLGMVESSATLLVTMIALGNVMLQIPLGLLADRVDRVRLLLVCASVGVGGAALMPWIAQWPIVLMAVLFVWGGFVAGLYTVGLVHLGSRFSGTDLAAANAAFVMMYAVGMTLGLPLFGAAMDVWNPHGLAIAIALTTGAYWVLLAVQLARR